MTDPNQDDQDPFFRQIFDSDWNACVGVQGEEDNYVDGYIEAAIELVDAIIEKNLIGKRDTLVLPILYNARHGIELTLKYVTDRMVQAGLLTADWKRDHNIRVHWERLHDLKIGDEDLTRSLSALGPFVTSLSRVDADGQELRYHRNRDNEQSLADFSTVNLKLVQHSLRDLEKTLSSLKYRSGDFVAEVNSGSVTARCSRKDLFEIARMLPPSDSWITPEFDVRKGRIQERYGLGSRQFSLALDKIKSNREMAAIIGIETELRYLKDEDILWTAERWRNIHPPRSTTGEAISSSGLNYWDRDSWSSEAAAYNEVIDAIGERLSADALAELEVVYYTGSRWFTEYHNRNIERVRREHIAAQDRHEKIRHLIEKTNYLANIRMALGRLGRLKLTAELAKI